MNTNTNPDAYPLSHAHTHTQVCIQTNTHQDAEPLTHRHTDTNAHIQRDSKTHIKHTQRLSRPQPRTHQILTHTHINIHTDTQTLKEKSGGNAIWNVFPSAIPLLHYSIFCSPPPPRPRCQGAGKRWEQQSECDMTLCRGVYAARVLLIVRAHLRRALEPSLGL